MQKRRTNIPTTLITSEGKLTEVVIGFLVGGFGFSESSLRNTVWKYGPGNFIYDHSKPNAITWFNKVYYAEIWSNEDNIAIWMRYIVHEQRHRYDIDISGGIRFYTSYLQDYFQQKRNVKEAHQAYLNIYWEELAYSDEYLMADILTKTDFLEQWEGLLETNPSFSAGFELGKKYFLNKF